MISKPNHLLSRLSSAITFKPLPQVLLERRATSHFKPDPVPCRMGSLWSPKRIFETTKRRTKYETQKNHEN